MKLSDFDYQLPDSAIAQHPLKQRDQSRLLLLNRKSGELQDKKFFELPQYLSANDLLVVNNCKVIPARIFAKRKTGANLEITLLSQTRDSAWECLVKGKKPKEGEEVDVGGGVKNIFLNEMDLDQNAGFLGGLWKIRFSEESPGLLEKLGVPPLPPYIKRASPEDYEPDRKTYQTIFAQNPGAVAAPTAGLHFTKRVLNALHKKRVEMAEITLYVSYGTFAPVRVEKIEEHKMYSEKFQVSKDAALKINHARSSGKKVIAVGTTVARTLEAASDESGKVSSQESETCLFITPGYQFKAIDALLTNFHAPRSTLLMLVSAFATPDLIKKAYQHALDHGYRFLSYGDCMLIL